MQTRLMKMIESLPARIGIVMGDVHEPEFRYQENEVFPSASVIKLFILWELYVQAEGGDKKLTDRIQIKEEKKVGGFGILTHLQDPLTLSLRDIATLMIISSDNTATNILIDELGMERINETCQKMGWNHTVLGRKMMDIQAKEAGNDNYSSPSDVADFFRKLLSEDSFLSKESKDEMLRILKGQQCNNKLPAWMDIPWEFAHKTGDLPYLEHDCGILFTPKGAKLLIVFSDELNCNADGVTFHNGIGKLAVRIWK